MLSKMSWSSWSSVSTPGTSKRMTLHLQHRIRIVSILLMASYFAAGGITVDSVLVVDTVAVDALAPSLPVSTVAGPAGFSGCLEARSSACCVVVATGDVAGTAGSETLMVGEYTGAYVTLPGVLLLAYVSCIAVDPGLSGSGYDSPRVSHGEQPAAKKTAMTSKQMAISLGM